MWLLQSHCGTASGWQGNGQGVWWEVPVGSCNGKGSVQGLQSLLQSVRIPFLLCWDGKGRLWIGPILTPETLRGNVPPYFRYSLRTCSSELNDFQLSLKSKWIFCSFFNLQDLEITGQELTTFRVLSQNLHRGFRNLPSNSFQFLILKPKSL